MKKHLVYLSLFTVLWQAEPLWAGKNVEELEKEVHALVATIQEQRQKPKGIELVDKLKQLSQQFETIEADQLVWQSFIRNYNDQVKESRKTNSLSDEQEIEIWLNQTPRQAVGSHLFYPKDTEQLRDSKYTEHFLMRNDMVWSYAIAARYQDPRGYYYLCHTLGNIWRWYHSSDEKADRHYLAYYKELVKLATLGLQQSADTDEQHANPEALSILVREENLSPRDKVIRGTISDLILQYCDKIAHSSRATPLQIGYAKTYLLNRRELFARHNRGTMPTFSEYREVAEKYRYGKALKEGMGVAPVAEKTDEGWQRMYEEAISKYGYYPAYIGMGIAAESKDPEKSLEYYKKAGEHGITEGYIEIARLYLLKDILNRADEWLAPYFSDIPEANVEEAQSWYAKAVSRGDYRGQDYLITLAYAMTLVEKENPASQYHKQFKDAVYAGLNLGSAMAYDFLERNFSPQEEKAAIQKYGRVPYRDLWQDIKAFIEKK